VSEGGNTRPLPSLTSGSITEAKQAATREKRLATAIEWMAEGKPRNWKYMKRK
jgi:hypothetical protein